LDKIKLFKILIVILPVIGIALPFWTLNFNAPMFGQKWLKVSVWGTGGVTGPLDQINIANHYVGLSPIEPQNMIEVKLLPIAFIISSVLLALMLFTNMNRRLLIIIYLIILLSLPAYFQYWLYNYGHNISSEAAIDIEPFTPLVMGSYQIANFKTTTYFDIGFWLMVIPLILALLVKRYAE